MNLLVEFVIAGASFAIIDAIWLSVVANKFYKSQLGPLLRDKPNMIAAVLFYVIFLIGLTVFVIHPAVSNNNPTNAALLGALFGLVTYATYDLTNFSTLKAFPLKVVIVDLIWGTLITTVVSVITYFIMAGWFQ